MTYRVYIDPRRLDKRLRVERKTTTKGASGGMVIAWVHEATVWAGIRGKTGDKEGATGAGGGDVPKATHEIEIRYREGLTPTTHRFRQVKHVGDDVIFDIRHVNDVYDQRAKMLVDVSTGVSSG